MFGVRGKIFHRRYITCGKLLVINYLKLRQSVHEDHCNLGRVPVDPERLEDRIGSLSATLSQIRALRYCSWAACATRIASFLTESDMFNIKLPLKYLIFWLYCITRISSRRMIFRRNFQRLVSGSLVSCCKCAST